MPSPAKKFMSGSMPAASKPSGKNSGILSCRGSQKMDPGKSGDEKALMRYANQTGGDKSAGATCVPGGAKRASKITSY